MNKKNFMICGITGWCIEILYTAFCSGLQKDSRLIGMTSLWMFPIYGLACLIVPVHKKIRHWPVLFRGFVYALGIMSVEFLSGSILKKLHSCPWDYSDAKASIGGIVRLDYLPLWMLVGLIFEHILCPSGRSS